MPSIDKIRYNGTDYDIVDEEINSRFTVIECTSPTPGVRDEELDYPTGFTQNNCVVLSVTIKSSTNNNWYYNEYEQLNVHLRSDKIVLQTGNGMTSAFREQPTKITLMRYI